MNISNFDESKIELRESDGNAVYEFCMDFRGYMQQHRWENTRKPGRFAAVASSTTKYMSGEEDDIFVTYRKTEPLPPKAPDAEWIEAPTSCYCAVLGRMAPCDWCTDPSNDPDAQEESP